MSNIINQMDHKLTFEPSEIYATYMKHLRALEQFTRVLDPVVCARLLMLTDARRAYFARILCGESMPNEFIVRVLDAVPNESFAACVVEIAQYLDEDRLYAVLCHTATPRALSIADFMRIVHLGCAMGARMNSLRRFCAESPAEIAFAMLKEIAGSGGACFSGLGEFLHTIPINEIPVEHQLVAAIMCCVALHRDETNSSARELLAVCVDRIIAPHKCVASGTQRQSLQLYSMLSEIKEIAGLNFQVDEANISAALATLIANC